MECFKASFSNMKFVDRAESKTSFCSTRAMNLPSRSWTIVRGNGKCCFCFHSASRTFTAGSGQTGQYNVKQNTTWRGFSLHSHVPRGAHLRPIYDVLPDVYFSSRVCMQVMYAVKPYKMKLRPRNGQYIYINKSSLNVLSFDLFTRVALRPSIHSRSQLHA